MSSFRAHDSSTVEARVVDQVCLAVYVFHKGVSRYGLALPDAIWLCDGQGQLAMQVLARRGGGGVCAVSRHSVARTVDVVWLKGPVG